MALIDVSAPAAHAPEPQPPLTQYLTILRKQGWVVAGCVLLGLAVSVAVSARTKPLYRAETLLSVEREQSNPLDLGSGANRDSTMDTRLETEVRLLTNRQVAERVVTKLGLAGGPPAPVPASPQSASAAEVPAPAFTAPASTASAPAGSATVADADRARGITLEAIALQNALDVRVVRNTNLIELSATAPTAARAAEIANATAQAYIDWKLEARYRLVAQAAQFLDSQIEQAKTDLEGKEQRLLAFARQRDILSADPQANSAMQRVEALNRDAAAALADRLSKEARYEGLRTSRPEVMAEVLSSPSLSTLRSDIARLEREYSDKLGLFKPEWPAMVQLKSQIERAKQHLETVTQETVQSAREQARNDLQLAIRREENIGDTLKTQRQEALKLGGQSVEYSHLRVMTDTQRALLDNLLKRQAEIQVMTRLQGERVSNIRIVESALPPTARFRPSYRRNALYGLFLGAVAGIVLAFLRDSLDRSVRTGEQVTALLKIPALASISRPEGDSYGLTPEAYQRAGVALSTSPKGGVELIAQLAPSGSLAESYRALRTAVLLSQADGLRSVVVTSAIPLEGKTTTSSNLAIVLAQLGMNVLLVDADLHRSRLHEVFQISNRSGLVSALVGAVDPPETFVQTGIPGLCVTPAGPAAPNPSNLLASQAMRRFLDRARSTFDFVVLDTPPILALSDGVVLGSLTDGVLLCIKAGSTRREQAFRAVDLLRRNGVRVLGAILNQVPPSPEQSEIDGYRQAYTKTTHAVGVSPAEVPSKSGERGA